MSVSFSSGFLKIAVELFKDEFPTHLDPVISTARVTFTFSDDTQVRDVRAWLSYAFGCGLIYSPIVQAF